jgi:hypothetical protein
MKVYIQLLEWTQVTHFVEIYPVGLKMKHADGQITSLFYIYFMHSVQRSHKINIKIIHTWISWSIQYWQNSRIKYLGLSSKYSFVSPTIYRHISNHDLSCNTAPQVFCYGKSIHIFCTNHKVPLVRSFLFNLSSSVLLKYLLYDITIYSLSDKQSSPARALCTRALAPHDSLHNASIPSLPKSCEFNISDSSFLWPFLCAIQSCGEASPR